MKKFLIILTMLVLMASMTQATMTNTISSMPTTYWQNQKSIKYLWLWAQEVEGDLGSGLYLQLTPTTEPTGAEGMVYYDSASDTLKVYTGAAFVALATAAGNSLDLSYDAGTSITVDAGAVTLTTSAASDSAALAIVHGETGNYSGLTMTNASAYPGIQITTSGAGADITGTSATWSVAKTGAITCAGVTTTGAVTVTAADVTFDDTYDLMWDTSEDTLIFKDNAVLGFGNTGTDPDVEIKWDEDSLNITAAAADTPLEIGGTTYGFDITYYFETAGTVDFDFDGDNVTFSDAIDLVMGTDGDWIIECDTAKTLELIPATTDESSAVNIGANSAGADLKLFGATSGAYALWDASADQLVVAGGGQISLNDDVELLIGTGTTNAGDFKISGTSAPSLVIDVVSAGSGSIEIGNDGDDVPLTWFGETASAFFKLTSDDVQIDGMSLCIGEGDQIQFGDALGTGDVTLSCTTNLLTFGQVVAGTGAVAYGVDDAGVDVTFYGDTASYKCWWDASGDEWFFGADTKGTDVTFYAVTTGDYIKWDASGATNLGALIFEDSVLQFVGANVTYNTAISTDALAITATDHANASITIGTAATTNSIDFTLQGIAAGNLVKFDGGAETFTLTDVDLVCTAPDATDVAATFNAGGANTASVVKIDGSTGDAAWVGADNVGMLHISGDGVGAHAGASLLQVTNSAQPIAAAEGFLARFVDTGAARTDAYAVEIEVTDTTGGLYVDGHSTFTKGLQTGNQSVTATADGLMTGLIPSGASFVTVTTDNADKVVVLPTAVIGNVIRITSPTIGCELETLALSNATINGVDCDGGNQCALAANNIYTVTCIAADTWVIYGWTNAGAAQATIVPDAD